MQNSDAKLLEKVFRSLAFHGKPGFHNFRVISMFQRIQFIQVNAISLSSDVVMQFKTQQIECLYIVFMWSFAFTREGLEDVFWKTSCRRLKTRSSHFHSRPIYGVFETKIKIFLRCLCDVNVSAGDYAFHLTNTSAAFL